MRWPSVPAPTCSERSDGKRSPETDRYAASLDEPEPGGPGHPHRKLPSGRVPRSALPAKERMAASPNRMPGYPGRLGRTGMSESRQSMSAAQAGFPALGRIAFPTQVSVSIGEQKIPSETGKRGRRAWSTRRDRRGGRGAGSSPGSGHRSRRRSLDRPGPRCAGRSISRAQVGPVGFEPTTSRLSAGPSEKQPFGTTLSDLGPGPPTAGRHRTLVRLAR